MRFENNVMGYSKVNQGTTGIYNNFQVSMNDANKRYKEIHVVNNTFTNMLLSQYSFMKVEFYTTGIVNIIGNTFYNCSSGETNMIEIDATDTIYLEDNTFDSCVSLTNSFLWTANSKLVNITGLEVTNTVKGVTFLSGTMIDISTSDLGSCLITNSRFHSNFIRNSLIRIDETVGEFDFLNNEVTNEVIESFTNYIIVEKPYRMNILN